MNYTAKMQAFDSPPSISRFLFLTFFDCAKKMLNATEIFLAHCTSFFFESELAKV